MREPTPDLDRRGCGVIGVWLGFKRADAIVGLLIGLVILGILIGSMRTVGKRLTDGVDDGPIEQMTTTARRCRKSRVWTGFGFAGQGTAGE